LLATTTAVVPEHRTMPTIFSPDGSALALGTDAGVQMLDGSTLAPLAGLPSDDQPVTALAFSPDGKRLAVGDEGGHIRLYDAASRKLLVTTVGFPTRDGSKVSPDWFAGTPGGYYAWPDSAAPLIRFRKNGKLYPASAFEKTLRKMDLLGG
jgi:WD40 repeat protein